MPLHSSSSSRPVFSIPRLGESFVPLTRFSRSGVVTRPDTHSKQRRVCVVSRLVVEVGLLQDSRRQCL